MAKHLKDKKITLYLETNLAAPGGMPKPGYKPIHPGKLWAYVRQLSQKELFYASADYSQETMLFEINWRPGLVTTEHFVEYRGTFYDIKRIDTYEGYRDTIRITAAECASQPAPDKVFPYDG